jgi:antitoxin HigA-1
MLEAKRTKHQALKRLIKSGDESKINPQWRRRVRAIVSALNVAVDPKELNLPGYAFHELKKPRKGTYAVTIQGTGASLSNGTNKDRLMWIWRTIMDDEEEMDGLPFRPTHPGEILREDILPALGMQVKELAEHLGVTRQSLSALLHEKRGVSVEMAQRLGQAFKNGARFWLALQMQHDLWDAEQKSRVEVAPLNWKSQAA